MDCSTVVSKNMYITLGTVGGLRKCYDHYILNYKSSPDRLVYNQKFIVYHTLFINMYINKNTIVQTIALTIGILVTVALTYN